MPTHQIDKQEKGQNLATESTFLLDENTHRLRSSLVVTPSTRSDEAPVSRRMTVLTLLCAIAVGLILIPEFNIIPSAPSPEILRESLAPDVVTDASSTTFGEVAQAMVPSWYSLTLSQLSVLTPDVQPGNVYKARKIILKTRDLLDVFSLVYPNDTFVDGGDLWASIRHYVAMLYRTVGEFQDLHNAHVRYSQEQMEAKREVVLNWVQEFEVFRQAHPSIPRFLRSPTDNSYVHKESHLFWQDVEKMPAGTDPITPSLQKLGLQQVRRALLYLNESLQFTHIMNETVHQIYHNLRKELRSITDEFDLFLYVMFPESPRFSWGDTWTADDELKAARSLLGSINDDWTAYSIYVENDEYHLEQQRLAKRIQDGWTGFKLWVEDVNLTGVLGYLESVMEVSASDVKSQDLGSSTLKELGTNETSPDAPNLRKSHSKTQTTGKPPVSLLEFLKERKRHPTNQLVIGNEAGDADTIISAISLAYIESVEENEPKTPVVAIPEADLETQRPEVKLLLELAGISRPAKSLIFVDDPFVVDDSFGAQITLTDHNILAESLQQKNWVVSEIVDHHEDEGEYLDTCHGGARTIAFAKEKALVASACTLVAERLKRHCTPPYPTSIAIILLGVILLDSVNLSVRVGKVTERDRDAVDNLLRNTDWQSLPSWSKVELRMNTSSSAPDPTILFDILQGSKYDPSFWNSLSVRDALRLDYKEFSADGRLQSFGISTVLMPLDDFLAKDDIMSRILLYMQEVEVRFLGIMFAYQDSRGRLNRQLAICGKEEVPIDTIAAFLLQPDCILDMEEIPKHSLRSENNALGVRFFNQRNVKPSRKQIGPILEGYFANQAEHP